MKKYSFLNTIKKVTVCLFAVTALSGCTLDVNVDPNNPKDVPVQTLLTSAQVNLAYTIGGNVNRITGSVVQHYAGHRGQPWDYARYSITSASTDNLWSSLYAGVLMDLKEIKNKANQENNAIYAGISDILTAYTYSVLTDIYGDIPFSETLQGVAGLKPKYDKQSDIYPALISLIEQGIASVKTNSGTNPAAADVMYQGNIDKWERFGNSLKLRLLNHLEKVKKGTTAAFLKQNPRLIESNAQTAKVGFGTTASNANPIYQFDVLSGRKDMAVASTIVDYMKSKNDPRVSVFFKKITNNGEGLQGQIYGNPPGGDNDDSGESKYSRVGSAYASINSPVYLLSASEVEFIKAEVYLNLSDNVSAEVAYKKAITLDMENVGVSNADAMEFIKHSVAFDGTLEQVMTQKWVTMFQAPFESWVDWRRTGFPVLNVAQNNRTSEIPRKIVLPQTELNLNTSSVEAGPGMPVPFEGLLQRVWWDTK